MSTPDTALEYVLPKVSVSAVEVVMHEMISLGTEEFYRRAEENMQVNNPNAYQATFQSLRFAENLDPGTQLVAMRVMLFNHELLRREAVAGLLDHEYSREVSDVEQSLSSDASID